MANRSPFLGMWGTPVEHVREALAALDRLFDAVTEFEGVLFGSPYDPGLAVAMRRRIEDCGIACQQFFTTGFDEWAQQVAHKRPGYWSAEMLDELSHRPDALRSDSPSGLLRRLQDRHRELVLLHKLAQNCVGPDEASTASETRPAELPTINSGSTGASETSAQAFVMPMLGDQHSRAPSELSEAVESGDAILRGLVSLYTNGVADERIKKAVLLFRDGQLTVNAKLAKLNALLPIPPTVSAQQLGEALGVSKTAILKSDWWQENRRGEKASEIGRRHEGHRQRKGRSEDATTRYKDDTE